VFLTKALTALDMDKVAANMRHPASGVPVKTRKRRLQVFANAFVGSDAVDVNTLLLFVVLF
jgi:hypothetical protein